MTPDTTAFPQELPPRPEQTSWKDRNCPGSRGCWSFSWGAYSLATTDKAVLARRICMITTLGVRTALSVLGILFNAYSKGVGGMIIGIILAVIGFLFIAWCLASIGEARGTRKVLGTSMGRWHFDVFLFASALVHIAFLIGFFTGMGNTGFLISWYGMWILIFAVAWITTWTPEQPISNV
ncbi:hypothetical protein F4781DRAFT_83544 [Annulohypoxylon bovei var. microspora]|nr:hypothetical protein F4781DRAFT_83544 [Annulohypoxylon bovei var. microspora]